MLGYNKRVWLKIDEQDAKLYSATREPKIKVWLKIAENNEKVEVFIIDKKKIHGEILWIATRNF
jgi:hypothetical protein